MDIRASGRPEPHPHGGRTGTSFSIWAAGLSVVIALLTAVTGANTHTRTDLDNIIALLSKDKTHPVCQQNDCLDKSKRMVAVYEYAKRIPVDFMRWH